MEALYWMFTGILLGVASSAMIVLALLRIWGSVKRSEPEASPELPSTNLSNPEVEIADMRVGESAYTLSWAMQLDAEDGSLWLRGDYPACAEECGTVSLHIERCEQGHVVDLNRSGEYAQIIRRGPHKPKLTMLAHFRPQPVVELRD